MKRFRLKKGLDIPLQGAPEQAVRPGPDISEVALTADDYIGLKPTMLVKEGEPVKLGQPLFKDKKNRGVVFTAPGSGRVKEIKRGLKRKFEALIIELNGDDAVDFPGLESREVSDIPAGEIRRILLESGLWCGFRTRPYGRIPAADAVPASLFVTAMDTAPLAADPGVIISAHKGDFRTGLEILHRFLQVPVNLCLTDGLNSTELSVPGINIFFFSGPHPAGLPSTHIHFIDPVHEKKQVWHICSQDVIGIGHLFRTGRLSTERIIALGGPGVKKPGLLRTRPGASIQELCAEQLDHSEVYRVLSGSVLDGRHGSGMHAFLGRYHRQVSVIREENSRRFLGWLMPGTDRFSSTGLFLSSLFPARTFSMNTAAWGGRRAIFPLGTYEKVMPLDIIATPLLKSLAVSDTEKSSALGCLELIEEDLALCSFVCPGKNNYGLLLRSVLTTIEREGMAGESTV